MSDDEFYTLVDDTIQELFSRIPRHRDTIHCNFPGDRFPQDRERQFIEEVLSRLNERYSDRYKAYWKNFGEGFYIVDKEYEKNKIE